jgi:hypothetical protein
MDRSQSIAAAQSRPVERPLSLKPSTDRPEDPFAGEAVSAEGPLKPRAEGQVAFYEKQVHDVVFRRASR